ncbi:hypothetical protein Tco_1338002 [Tanacetum coccineum]
MNEDEEMDYTTSQLYDDVDIRLNEPVDTNKGFIQEEGTNAEITNIHQGNENPEISQVIEDAYVTLSTVPHKTDVPVTSSSHSSDLAAKLVIALEKEVAELKKDPFHTQVTALVDDHLDARLGETKDEFMNFLSALLIVRITKQVKNQLPQILPEEVSNFAPLMIQKMVKESPKDVVLAKESSQPQSSYDAAAMLTEFELKKILIDKMDKSESYLITLKHRECYKGLIKSYDLNKTLFSTYDKLYSLKRSRKDKYKDEDPSAGSDRGLKKRKTSKDAELTKEEPEFEVVDSDMPQDQEENPGNDDEEPKEKTPEQGQNQSWLMTLASSADKPSKIFDELMSTPIDFSAYIMNEYDFEECYKALSEKLYWENPEGDDYLFDLTKPLHLVISGNHQKIKAALYDLPDIEDMVPNIWVPVIVAYDKHALWGISLWREQHKTFYGFKEGDFPRLRINDINDTILLKRVEDFQLGVKSYQKKINVTKTETTKSGIRKRNPYTPYQDPQGFIYVNNNGRIRLMRSDGLY